MLKPLLIFLLLFSGNAFSQLYFGNKNHCNFYVEMTKEGAHVEAFRYFHYSIGKRADEHLLPSTNAKSTIFKGPQSQILKTNNKYFLLYKFPNKKKAVEIELTISPTDPREEIRKKAYLADKIRYLRRFEDSLSGAQVTLNMPIREPFRFINDSGQTSGDYARLIDSVSDSLITKIIELKDPSVNYFYSRIDSLQYLDTMTVYSLLEKTNYTFFYSQYILQKIALEKPGLLIRYLDKKPTNKKTVLRTIKYHRALDEIVNKVKESPLKTKGKREIVRQKAKRQAGSFFGGVTYVTIILAEFSLLILLFAALFKL